MKGGLLLILSWCARLHLAAVPGVSYFNYFPTTEKSTFWPNGCIR